MRFTAYCVLIVCLAGLSLTKSHADPLPEAEAGGQGSRVVQIPHIESIPGDFRILTSEMKWLGARKVKKSPVTLRKGETLGFSANSTQFTDEHLIRIPITDSLTWVSFNGCASLSDRLFDVLRKLTRIQLLVLASCSSLTDSGFAHLADLQALVHLSIGGTNIGNNGLRAVLALPELQVLETAGCRAFGDGAFVGVKNTSKLKVLDIRSTRITDETIKTIALLGNLEDLKLSFCSGITGKHLGELSTLKSLRSLECIALSSLADEDMLKIKSMECLIYLNMGKCTKLKCAWLKDFASLTQLEYLGLSETLIDSVTIKSISGATSLRMLDISGCVNIKAQDILDLLPNLTALGGLNIQKINLSQSEVEKIQKALPEGCHIFR